MYSDKHVSNFVNFNTICVIVFFGTHFLTIQYIVDIANICFRNELSINRGTIYYHYFPKCNKTYYYLFHFWFKTRYLWFDCEQITYMCSKLSYLKCPTKPSTVSCLVLQQNHKINLLLAYFL